MPRIVLTLRVCLRTLLTREECRRRPLVPLNRNETLKKGRYRVNATRSASVEAHARGVLVVLASDEAQRDLKFSDIIRIGVLHLVHTFKPLL